jgi:hypothetical protein
MIINSKIFHLPPYISISWNYVAALHLGGTSLIVTTLKGNLITVPNLSPELLEKIFQAHALYLENNTSQEKSPSGLTSAKNLQPFAQALMNAEQNMELPFRFGFSTFDGLGSALQHNQAQSNAPDLPEEILQKISAIAKIVTPEDQAVLPKAEPHCNCMHCQIARAINTGINIIDEQSNSEEPVSEDELNFQPWEIQQNGDKMYTVTNRLTLLKYNVYLGEPIGCTCGQVGCEHILAVLKS